MPNETKTQPVSPDRQVTLDASNSSFWDELCGTHLAETLGITADDPEGLTRFDAEYMRLYPYLPPYVLREGLTSRRVLEIGLGFGTLGQFIAEQGAVYHGLDIAPNAVDMMRCRLKCLGIDPADHVRVGSALDIPFESGTFDYVYSIGCLHHTGDIPRALNEVNRVLCDGGKAVIMLYNRHSLRMCHMRVREWIARACRLGRPDPDEQRRAAYDANKAGDAAPHTDFVSRREVRRMLRSFRSVRIDVQNMDPMFRGRIARERLLNNIGRVVGLDLYIVATK